MISELQPHADCRKSLKCPLRTSLQSICNLNHSLCLLYSELTPAGSIWSIKLVKCLRTLIL